MPQKAFQSLPKKAIRVPEKQSKKEVGSGITFVVCLVPSVSTNPATGATCSFINGLGENFPFYFHICFKFLPFSTLDFMHVVSENIEVSLTENISYTQEKKETEWESSIEVVVINLSSGLAVTCIYSSSITPLFICCFIICFFLPRITAKSIQLMFHT